MIKKFAAALTLMTAITCCADAQTVTFVNSPNGDAFATVFGLTGSLNTNDPTGGTSYQIGGDPTTDGSFIGFTNDNSFIRFDSQSPLLSAGNTINFSFDFLSTDNVGFDSGRMFLQFFNDDGDDADHSAGGGSDLADAVLVEGPTFDPSPTAQGTSEFQNFSFTTTVPTQDGAGDPIEGFEFFVRIIQTGEEAGTLDNEIEQDVNFYVRNLSVTGVIGQTVPEPGTATLLALAGLTLCTRRRKS